MTTRRLARRFAIATVLTLCAIVSPTSALDGAPIGAPTTGTDPAAVAALVSAGLDPDGELGRALMANAKTGVDHTADGLQVGRVAVPLYRVPRDLVCSYFAGRLPSGGCDEAPTMDYASFTAALQTQPQLEASGCIAFFQLYKQNSGGLLGFIGGRDFVVFLDAICDGVTLVACGLTNYLSPGVPPISIGVGTSFSGHCSAVSLPEQVGLDLSIDVAFAFAITSSGDALAAGPAFLHP